MNDEGFTDDERAEARDILEGRISGRGGCVFCAGIHDYVVRTDTYDVPLWRQPCPRIKRIAWNETSNVTEVEFWPPGSWETNVIFPSDVYAESDEGDQARVPQIDGSE